MDKHLNSLTDEAFIALSNHEKAKEFPDTESTFFEWELQCVDGLLTDVKVEKPYGELLETKMREAKDSLLKYLNSNYNRNIPLNPLEWRFRNKLKQTVIEERYTPNLGTYLKRYLVAIDED